MVATLPVMREEGSLATSRDGRHRKPTPPLVELAVFCALARKLDQPAFLCFLANLLREDFFPSLCS